MAAEEGAAPESPLLSRTAGLISDLRKIERRHDLNLLGDAGGALELVHRISDILNQFFLDFDAAMSRVIDVVLEVTGGMRGAVLLLDSSDTLEAAVARTADGKNLSPDDIQVPRALTDRVLAGRRGVLASDLPGGEDRPPADSPSDIRILSAICAPLKFSPTGAFLDLDERREEGAAPSEKVLGVIYVDSESVSNPLSEEGLYFLEAVSNHATAALRNARIYLEATRDSLTGLAIRRVFENRLREEMETARKEQTQLALLMTDLDHFKSVNDAFGHPVGDEVLRLTAGATTGAVRSTDLVARYGGEEFALILPHTSADEAFAIAQKIRERVGALRFQGGNGRITISVGVAEFPAHAETAEELVRQADRALYAAKEQGRNRTVVWSESLRHQTAREDKLAGILTGEWSKDYRNVSTLLETLDLINSAEDWSGIVKAVVEKMVEITDADRGILLLGGDADDLSVHLALDKKGQKLPSPVRFSRSVVHRVLGERLPLAIVDTIDDLEGEPPPESVVSLDIRSMMCAPLMARGKVIGTIYVDSRRRAQGFMPGDLAFFNAMAAQIAGVLERRLGDD
jgi:diguanylate cyclase (GGDEF)-like protein